MEKKMKSFINEVKNMICIKCKKCGFVYNKRFDVCPKCKQDPNKPVGTMIITNTGEFPDQSEQSTPRPAAEPVSVPEPTPVAERIQEPKPEPKTVKEINFSLSHVQSNQNLNIKNDVTTFGRYGDCSIVLNSEKISRQHSKIIKKDSNCYLLDCGSTNGTFLNDERLESNKEYKLSNGDIFKVFTVEFKFIKVITEHKIN